VTLPHGEAAERGRASADRRVIALAFDSALRAQEAVLAALGLQERGRLVLHDAVFVTRPGSARAKVTETTDPTPIAAAVPASLLGAFVGTVLAGPLGLLIGGVLGGGGGVLAAKLIDTGIPDRVIAELRGRTKPGQYVVAFLVSDIAPAAAVEELQRFQGAHLVYDDLSPVAHEVVLRALHEQG
jgi:uncharacterized membrane protein